MPQAMGFKLSKDPLFLDIVGLYLNPPDKRWCCASMRRRRFSARSQSPAAADATGPSRTPDPGLCASWHHQSVRRARRQGRHRDWRVSSAPPRAGVSQLSGNHRHYRAGCAGVASDPGQLRHSQDPGHQALACSAIPAFICSSLPPLAPGSIWSNAGSRCLPKKQLRRAVHRSVRELQEATRANSHITTVVPSLSSGPRLPTRFANRSPDFVNECQTQNTSTCRRNHLC